MRKLFIGLLGATALVGASAASAQVVPLSAPTTQSGSQATYVTTAGTITATGYSAPGTTTPLNFKMQSGLENGLGLTDDPSGQGEISDSGPNMIQLDMSGLNSGTMVSFLMGSTTDNEGWAVFGTNTAGCVALGTMCGTSILAMTNDQGNWHSLGVPAFTYYDFYATGRSNGTYANVLLDSLSLSAVPEPSTWAMMLLGFGAIGMAARRSRRKVALAQLA